MQDIVIIGAGIVGSFLAKDLARYNLKVTVIDKLNDVANATTMANSAIIHTGYDPKDGTLKAELNVIGARMYKSICEELGADYLACGALVVATNEVEEQEIYNLEARAKKRNIACEILKREDLLKLEPNLSDLVTLGISFPETAIIYPWEVAINSVATAVINGTELRLGEEVLEIKRTELGFLVKTTKGEILTKMVINAAGVGAEAVARSFEEPPFKITPRKGEYFVLSKLAKNYCKHIVYPTPTSLGKGVLIVPTTHGNTLIGPNALETTHDDLAVTSEGLSYIRKEINKTMKTPPFEEIIRSFVGLRASGNNGDFYINHSINDEDFIHVACIDSPGLASAPAISKYVIENFISPRLDLVRREDYQKFIPITQLNRLSDDKRNELIKENPLYGEIVCKCENISYQEIVDAIHMPVGAKSIKGVKKRIRPGMGKCQGGFCEVMVAKILAKELGISLADVLYDETDSKLGSEVK